MTDVTKQVSQVISFQCQKCADDNVSFKFYPGNKQDHPTFEDTGYLKITCNACGITIDIDPDKE